MKDRQKDIFFGYEYDESMNKNKRKTYGTFYTPDFIVDYIIENTIECEKVIENPFIAVLDPSCGSGYFLVKVYDKLKNIFLNNIDLLKNKYKNENYIINTEDNIKNINGTEYWVEENLHYHIIEHCIFGADIDAEAVQFAAMNLTVKNGSIFIKPNIICCDSLIQWEKEHTSGSKFCFWNKKFDYIVGNPPWVSLNRRHGHKNYMTEYYMKTYSGNKYLPNLYEYFINRSIQVLKQNGRLGFVVPDRFAKNINLKNMRKSILENYSIVNLGFEIDFPGITTDTMIFVIKKDEDKANKIKVNIYDKRSYFVSQKDYFKNPNYEFSYENREEYFHIKEKIDKYSFKLSSISSTFTGFIGEKKKISKVKVKKEEVPIIKGENIESFKIHSKYYYEFIRENLKGGTQCIEKLACPMKIVVRKTGKNLIAALDDTGYIIEQSLYGIIKVEKSFSYKYILGILNSSLMQWYYINFLVTNLKSTPQIKKCDLDNIPIKLCDEDKQNIIEDLVTKMIETSNVEKLQKLKEKLNENVFNLYDISDVERTILGK